MKRITLLFMLIPALMIAPAYSAEDMLMDVSVSVCYLMPIGDFGDLYESGYGVVAGFSERNLLIKNLEMGVEAGYLSLSGKHEQVDSMTMIPVLLTAGYRLAVYGSISLLPRVAFGYSYNSIEYSIYSYDAIVGSETRGSKSEKAFEPVGVVSLTVSYPLMNRYNVNAGAEYGSIFEDDGNMNYFLFKAGIGMRL